MRRMYTGGIDQKNLKNIQQTDRFKAAVDEVEEIMKGKRTKTEIEFTLIPDFKSLIVKASCELTLNNMYSTT